jgi:uncharacterized protein YceH (UPF0502 family)
MTLDQIQIRVLGALIEKEIATPENYPLSLNGLVAACNQRSSRDPVMELTEDEVRQALHTLQDMELTAVVRDSRVAKYEHRIRTILNLRRDETAILCLLLLRGPQTPGELRARADRLYSFDGIEAVESTLGRLTAVAASSTGEDTARAADARPLAAVLPRQPGSREARYVHLLSGAIVSASMDSSAERLRPRDLPAIEQASEHGSEPGIAARMCELEAEVAGLRAAIAQIEARLEAGKSTVMSTGAQTAAE